MNFRLPAKYALLIINILVLAYFFLYFCLLGFEYQSSDLGVTIIFKGLNFNHETDLILDPNNGKWIVPFGQTARLFEILNNQVNPGNVISPNIKEKAFKLDGIIIAMMSIQCVLIFLSFINLFIWRGFKKAKTVDITSKLLILSFVGLAIAWVSIMNSNILFAKFQGNNTINVLPTKYQAEIYWIGQAFMPMIFMFIHIWMTAPLYRKRNKY
ncbi:hypothetical protein [Spiroplasma endosymbiont of Diplazon laetatorius]|uniref:hypothetical protein n=1 Tax=Spiroplasma endosymbiont of Diplazon laetatorius TaxID=3066322 RepID=UPI0030CEB7B4